MGQGITTYRIKRLEDRVGTGASPGEAMIDDGAYPTSWDTDTVNAASRNALFDQIELMPELATNETITGAWTHTGQTIFSKATTTGVPAWSKVTGMSTAELSPAIALTAVSASNMTDGFGTYILFSGTDDTASGLFAFISGVRDGADAHGKLVFSPYSTVGVSKDALEVTSTTVDVNNVLNVTNSSGLGRITVDDDILVDTIDEKTGAAGVTIDSVLIKDGLVDGVDVSLLPTYGGISLNNGTTAQADLDTTPVLMTGWGANLPSNNVTPAYGSNQITIVTTGIYQVFFQCSFTGSAATTFHMHPRVDTVEVAGGTHRYLSGGDVGTCSFTTILSLTAAEVLTIYVNAAAGSAKTVTPEEMQLTVVYLGAA